MSLNHVAQINMLCQGCCRRLLRLISADLRPGVREVHFGESLIRTFGSSRWSSGQETGKESFKKVDK